MGLVKNGEKSKKLVKVQARLNFNLLNKQRFYDGRRSVVRRRLDAQQFAHQIVQIDRLEGFGVEVLLQIRSIAVEKRPHRVKLKRFKWLAVHFFTTYE